MGNDPFVHPLGATVTWSIATANYPSDPFKFDTSIGDAGFIAAIRDAFDAWERVTNINFVEVSDSSTVDIRLGYQNIDGPSGTLGETLSYYIGSELVQSYIAFDPAENWDVNFGQATWGISAYSTALHEIGHAIGIDHSDDSGAIMAALYNNAQSLTQDDIEAAQAIYGAPVTPPTVPPVAGLSISTLIIATDQNLSQFKGLTAAYSLLGGVPTIDGYTFLINRNNETNFGAGGTTVFNDENIYINTVNALYQDNGAARANFDAIVRTKETPNDKLSLIYDHIIPEDARTDDGRTYFLSQADFYTARAGELGIDGANGAAVVAFAALTKIAVDNDTGFGGQINDLIEAVENGTAAIPESGDTFTPIETALGGNPAGPVSSTSGTDAAVGKAGDGIDFASLKLLRVDDEYPWGIDGPNTLVAEERANGSDVSNYVYSSMPEVPEPGATGETDTAILSVIPDDDGSNFVPGIGPEVEDMAWTDFI